MSHVNNNAETAQRDEDRIVFGRNIPGLGRFDLRPLRIDEDASIVHDWVNREYAKYWGLLGTTVDGVRAAYQEIAETANAYLGLHDGEPAFLLECYRALDDRISSYYDAQSGDYGMHILVAPAERRIHKYTWHVFTVVMDFMFSDDAVERVVVEPDVRNEKIHVLNRRAGFEYERRIDLPEKTAWLAFCTRPQYAAALEKEGA